MKTRSIPRQARDGEQSRTILALAIIALLVCTAAEAKYSGGTGEPNDPYQIADVNDLLVLAADTNDYNKCFILTADIDLDPNLPGNQVWTKAIIAADTVAGGGFDGTAFTGTFDGSGHKITHFTIDGGNNWWLGLFGYIDGGSVKNLGLENCTVSGSGYVGGLVGYNNGDSISNCYSTGSVSGSSYVGGLVGFNYSSISNCYSTGTVSGGAYVGGLVGRNYYGSINNCYSTGAVSGQGSGGGLVGVNGGGISNCYSTGTVSGFWEIGGLVGENWGTTANCYSTGSVSGTSYVGGLVGVNGGSISNCYSTGAVSGDGAGGLVGCNFDGGSISNCYSTGTVSGTSNVGGLVGYNYTSGIIISSFWDTNTSGQPTSAGGEGKTTAEMKTLATFTSAGWDFVEIWGIGENQTYPYLRTEPAGDLNHDKKVDFEDFAIFASHWLEGTGP